ncbi:hypothetical protein [Desulforamulus hydrothermalis]|uniref:Uncharacterized protein n=1 Tax=Desulforamulus hydrothermalis Lam5 = DSM 18033 TaxID=1121428 RepID=K8DY75_9FIRM|nr:hypothetical protein [Desulforamulus hydrothermalis]CCO07709.1 conserved hypothetical protein [Desulforamulus hydrothermalis Lam5 = DSM 18033]SHH33444.1 CRISPR-associated protein (Cas_Cas02710) [Desulforamulus hydrothermalis Lam5 = DSM 18033]
MKVLLSFVGEQDPYSDKTSEEGSIVTLCRHLKPETVYLFPTAAGFNVRSETQSRAVDTENWIKSEVSNQINVFIRPLPFSDPTDYAVILPLTRRTIEGILQETKQVECEFHINCSSGTPQLKSTWLILANAGMLTNCHLWQVANPLYNQDKRINRLEVTFLEEENLLARIKQYAREFLFQGIAQECERLKDITLYSYRKEKAQLLAKIFKAYQSWDLIRYNDAYQRLNSVYVESCKARDLSELVNVLEPQVKVLAELKQNHERENQYNLVDLYMNARRRLVRSDYTDALSRFWRIYEGVLFYYFRKHYQIEPKDLQNSQNQNCVQAIWQSKYFIQGIKQISIANSVKILKEVLQDKTFNKLNKQTIMVKRGQTFQSLGIFELLEELRGKRNESIVAHGMKPITEDDAINCITAAEAIIKGFIPEASQLITNYPLDLLQVLKVIEVLDKAFSL